MPVTENYVQRRVRESRADPLVRLITVVALIVIALVAACRDSVPTDSPIAVHAHPGRICSVYPGPINCLCEQGNPSYCFADDSLPPIPDESFAVDCFQDSQIRGSQVRCSGYFGTPRLFSVIERTVKGKGFNTTLSDTILVPADSSRFRWYGTAVATSTVTIKVTYRDSTNHPRTVHGTAKFTVLPRPASDPAFLPPRAVYDTVVSGIFTDYPFSGKTKIDSSVPGKIDTAFVGVFGLYVGPLDASLFAPSARDFADTVIRGTGPNSQLFYWAHWPRLQDSSIAYVHPSLSGGFGNPGATYWFNGQTGPAPAKCGQHPGVDTLLAATALHEGATGMDKSHFGVMKSFVKQEKIAMTMEALYFTDSTHLVDSTQTLLDSILARSNVPQAKFDTTDRAKTFGNQNATSNSASNFGRIKCRIVVDTAYIDSAGVIRP